MLIPSASGVSCAHFVIMSLSVPSSQEKIDGGENQMMHGVDLIPSQGWKKRQQPTLDELCDDDFVLNDIAATCWIEFQSIQAQNIAKVG